MYFAIGEIYLLLQGPWLTYHSTLELLAPPFPQEVSSIGGHSKLDSWTNPPSPDQHVFWFRIFLTWQFLRGENLGKIVQIQGEM